MRSRHRFVAAVACLWLIASLFPATSTFAAPQLPGPEASVSLDNQGSCTEGGPVHAWAGMENSSSTPSQNRSGAMASFYLDFNNFDICTPTTGEPEGPSAWVAIVARDGTEHQIIQIGIIECRNTVGLENPCAGENSPVYAYAFGGCFPWEPDFRFMAYASYGTHTFTVYKGTDDLWHLSASKGGVIKASINIDDDLIDCWSDNTRASQWAYESWDNGDSFGNSTAKSNVTNARYGVYNQGWFDPLWANGACHFEFANHHCNKYSSDNFDVWTTN